MSNVTVVAGSLWTGTTGIELRRHGHAHQLLAAYLITAPAKSAYGLYRLPMVDLCEHTNLRTGDALPILRTLADLRFAFYDARAEWVWLVTMAKRQLSRDDMTLAHTDKRVLGMHAWYASIPSNPFLGPYFDYYGEMFHMPKRREGDMPQLPIGTGQDALFELAPPKQTAIERSIYEICERTFTWWWKHYPRKVGKPEALRKWLKVRPLMDERRTAQAIKVLEYQKRTAAWIESDGRYIPHPKTYIHQGRMFDDIPANDMPTLSPDDADIYTSLSKWEPPPDDDPPTRKRLK